MRNTLAIAKRETLAYFASPVAYVVAAVFLVVTGYFFAADLLARQMANLRGFLSPASFVLLLVAPMLTMRLFAEEQKMGTLELLLTNPVRDIEVVLGKYLASLATLAVMLALTFYYPLLLYWFGDPDTGPILTGYLGLFLLGAAMMAIGLLASSLSANQIVAAVLGFGLLILLWVVGSLGLPGLPGAVLSYISLPDRFNDFVWGIIDTQNILYYLSVAAMFVFLTVRSLEMRRWR
ncbi:MAG: ABC transporter permease subunit [Chloroflexi bacterium]|nr:ABC transporter permease subunit [Chloroflexota bacterium]